MHDLTLVTPSLSVAGEADSLSDHDRVLTTNELVSDGGPRRTRTDNPRIKSPLLCQLS